MPTVIGIGWSIFGRPVDFASRKKIINLVSGYYISDGKLSDHSVVFAKRRHSTKTGESRWDTCLQCDRPISYEVLFKLFTLKSQEKICKKY